VLQSVWSSLRKNCVQVGVSFFGLVKLLLMLLYLSRQDNAVMIGWASMHRFLAQDYDEYEIETRPKWDIEELQ